MFLLACLIMLMGIAALVIDLGRLYLAKAIAQNAADACVRSGLASVQVLSAYYARYDSFTNEAPKVADHWNDKMRDRWPGLTDDDVPWLIRNPDGSGSVKANYLDIASGGLIREDGRDWGVIFSSNYFRIAGEVRCCVPVSFTFGRIFGLTRSAPSAKATGVLYWDPVLKYTFAPWAIHYRTIWGSGFPYWPITPVGAPVQLTLVNPRLDAEVRPGIVTCIDFGDDYETRLGGGGSERTLVAPVSNETAKDQVTLYPVPGDVNVVTARALQTRFAGDARSFESWKAEGEAAGGSYPDSRRIVVVPVVNPPRNVWGFAPIYIELFYVDPNTGQGKLNCRFITATIDGGVVRWGLRERTPQAKPWSLVATLVIVN